jgi:hypothetical protein
MLLSFSLSLSIDIADTTCFPESLLKIVFQFEGNPFLNALITSLEKPI